MLRFCTFKLAAILACLGFALCIVAQPARPQMMGFQQHPQAASAGCSQATAYLARLTSPSASDIAGMTTTICNMVTHGTWTLLDYYYQFALNSTTNALINAPNATYAATVHGTPTFSSEHGYTNSGTDFIDLGFNPSTAGGNTTVGCSTIGHFSQTSRTTGVVASQGGDDSLHYTYLLLFNTGPVVQSDINGGDFFNISSGGASAKGAWAAIRDQAHVANTITIRQNAGGGFTGALTATSQTLMPNVNYYGLAINDHGSPNDFDPDQISALWAGCLTSAQSDSVTNDINGGIMTQLGINF